MSAVASEQVRAGLECRGEVEARPRTAGAADEAVELGADDGWACPPFAQARRDEPDDADRPRPRTTMAPPASVPAAAASVAASSIAASASGHGVPRELPPRHVRRVELAGQAVGGLGILGKQQVERDAGVADRPAAFSRGAIANATVSRSTRAGSIAGLREQGRDARPRAVPDPLEAQAGDRAVLAEDRREVRDRADAREVREIGGLPPAEQLRELERDAAAGQQAMRIGAVAALRIDDRHCRGQRRAERGDGP